MAFFEPIPGDFRYGYPQHASAPYEHVWIDLGGEMADLLWRQVVGASGSPVLDLGPDNPVAPLMLTLAHEHADRMPHDRYQASARIYEIIMVVCSVLGRSRSTTSHLVQRALRRIHQRGLHADLDVSTLAAELGVSREHFARAFTAATGLSPMQYLMQHRLRAVQDALRASGDSLEVIARACGFSGANYLCRAFRAHLGITPNAYRSQPWVVHTAPLAR
jgi:AraC-like DNA-binding protein